MTAYFITQVNEVLDSLDVQAFTAKTPIPLQADSNVGLQVEHFVQQRGDAMTCDAACDIDWTTVF